MTNDNMKTPLEQEIYSRLWFTYRKDFSPLLGNNNTKYTSDCGWGCMLRTGQMLIAQGLLYHIFGPDWSLYTSLRSDADISTYRELISLFNDRRSRECPFGIHNLLEIADKKASDESVKGASSRVGTWFGPTSVCLLMRDALNGAALLAKNNKQLKSVRIYVAQDCTIFKQDVIDLCTDSGRVEFMPCILLISARLGGESINEIYIDSLKMFFQMQNCIGMIGGRPKHSLYFIGYQSNFNYT
jgi:cysteine protease ATG4